MKFPQTLLLIIFGLLLAIGFLEIGLRLFPVYSGQNLVSTRPWYFYPPRRMPSSGIAEFKEEKPPGVFRISIVGDSFTYPYSLQVDDAFPARLEKILAAGKQRQQGKQIEVINLGQPGMSTLAEVEVARDALQHATDLLVLQITLNDPERDTFRRAAERHPDRYVFGPLGISREKTPFLYYFKTAGLIAARLHSQRTQETFIRYHHELFNESTSWKSFSSSIEKMKGLAATHQARFVCLLFPMLTFPLDERYPFTDVHMKIIEFLSRQEIPNLDLLFAYGNIPVEQLVVSGADAHPNEIAHRIAADELASWLAYRGHLPEDTFPSRIHRSGTRPAPFKDFDEVRDRHFADYCFPSDKRCEYGARVQNG